ncbi:MAG: hypothetical protein AAF798_17355 [Bacteroidota bacterium]
MSLLNISGVKKKHSLPRESATSCNRLLQCILKETAPSMVDNTTLLELLNEFVHLPTDRNGRRSGLKKTIKKYLKKYNTGASIDFEYLFTSLDGVQFGMKSMACNNTKELNILLEAHRDAFLFGVGEHEELECKGNMPIRQNKS